MLGLAVLFTVIAKALELAFVLEAHAFRMLILQVTTSPLIKELEENVVLFVPTLDPLIFHWNVGDEPPFVGTAVNVRLDPAHIDVVGALILILGEDVEFTVIPILLDIPTLLVAQIFELEITQVMVSR